MAKKYLIVIAGPTAVGKTEIAITLAQQFQTEIISADARQFYKEMCIGTAIPDKKQLATIKHHFIHNKSIQDNYNVGQYEKEVLLKIEELFLKHNVLILCGGSGLFIKAITDGLDKLPSADKKIRESLKELYAESGIKGLQDTLEDVDPVYYKKVDINNPQRLMRALEVFYATGKPISELHNNTVQERSFTPIKICLNMERELLYQQINNRVDHMFEAGLLDEVKNLFPFRNLNALQTVGYQELFDYLNNSISLEEAKEKIKQNTRHYAKRQLTWFRKDKDYTWIDVKDFPAILEIIQKQITE